ncbi:membrane protein insertase YidC [Kineococcus sp. G2]|uniref:membrane protein insertase YidC n=1 Tax=Kineococcus sp. G2 TaxID=3127484 RepID=UPI00301E1BB4
MIEFFYDLLYPIQWVVAWIMVRFHDLFTAIGLDPAGGAAWSLSIVGLVVVIRVLLIPLFVKQIKAMRGMQVIQPEMRKIQQKYKGKTDPASRQAMQQEMMALYRTSGTNPMASCLPILLQSPIFFALFHTLNGIGKGEAVGPLNQELVEQADNATLFGSQLSDIFLQSWGQEGELSTIVLTAVMIVLMSLSQFVTQKQLMAKNTSSASMEGNPFAQQQKMMLYILPIIFAVSGVNFPIGVLLYWLTTNVWSMGQQFFVIRRMPNPGSVAEKQLQERRARRAARRGQVLPAAETSAPTGGDHPTTAAAPVRRQRQQPKRGGSREKRRPSGSRNAQRPGNR